MPQYLKLFYREITLLPNKKGYLLMCLNFEKNYVGDYELTLFSDHLLADFENFENYFGVSCKTLYGCWNEFNCGGNFECDSFFLNPQ